MEVNNANLEHYVVQAGAQLCTVQNFRNIRYIFEDEMHIFERLRMVVTNSA